MKRINPTDDLASKCIDKCRSRTPEGHFLPGRGSIYTFFDDHGVELCSNNGPRKEILLATFATIQGIRRSRS